MPAALCMSVIGPYEDDPPNQRSLYLMSQDETDSGESTPTDAAPPLSDPANIAVPRPPNMPTGTSAPSTKPPRAMTQAELDAEADAIRASLTPAGIAKVAADKLIEMYQYTRGRDFELLDPKGKLASQQRDLLDHFKTEVVNELGAIVESVTGSAMAKMGKVLETHGNDIASMRRDIAGMKRQVKVLEKKVEELDAAQRAAAPPAAKP